MVLSGCAPYPVYVAPAPPPLLSDAARWDECTVIRREIGRQQRIAESSGVMATALVEASVRLNASNVISALEARAAIEGCRA
jgi:hypothetical protein